MLPVHIPTLYFRKIDSSLSAFLWKNKKPRIALSSLRKPKSSGGENFPDFRLYHKSFSLCQASKWLISDPSPFTPLWLLIEQTLLLPFSFKELLHFSVKTSHTSLPLFKHTCYLLKPLILPNTTSRESFLDSPIWHNSLILLNNRPVFWSAWRLKGIIWVKHLFNGISPCSFPQFQSLFHCLRSFLQKFTTLTAIILDAYYSLPPSPTSDTHNPLRRILLTLPKASLIYKFFSSPNPDRPKSKVELSWELDLDCNWSVAF